MKIGRFPSAAPHPHWRFPSGSVVVGQTETGRLITISAEMRERHLHCIGATGQGKTVCLTSMAWQDIVDPSGRRPAIFFFDPHGNGAHELYSRAVSYGILRIRSVHVLDPCSNPVFGLNFFRHRPGVDPAVTASMAADAVSAVWGGEDLHAKPLLTESLKIIFWSLDWLGATLLEADELTDIADDNPLRAYVMENAPNRAVRRFWRSIGALPPAKRDEKLAPAARRLGEFLLPQSTRRIFAARDRVVDFRAAMDTGACLLIDLSYGRGRLSKDEAQLLGTFMLNDIFLSCLGRPPGSPPVYIYIDEVQLFLTETVAAMLDQARKFGVHLILSHQHLGHLRERGEAIYRSVMTNTRTKIIFGGLDDDDATLMAKNLYRGTFDPELAKARYDKPVVIGQAREWLTNESDSRGTAFATGTTTTYGGSQSTSRSTTKSESATRSDSDTVSEADTISESDTVSESHTASESESLSDSHSSSSSAGRSSSSDYGEHYDYGDLMPCEYSRSRGDSSSSTDSSGSTHGTSSTRGSADTYGTGHTTGRAHTTGTAHTTGIAVTEGKAETRGTTTGTSWSRGSSTTTTASQQHTQGRGQTLASVFEVRPTIPYSIDEQVHLRSAELAQLDIGEAVVKIGKQPPYRIRTIRFREGWASPEHIQAVKQRIAAMTPFMTPVAEIAVLYHAWRKELVATVRQALNGVGQRSLDRPEPPPLKDEGWG